MTSAKGGFWQLYGWQLLVGGAITLVYVVVAWSSPEPESLAMRLVWWVGIVGYLALAMVANEWGFGLTASILVGLCTNALVWAFILIIASRVVSWLKSLHVRD